MSWRLFILSLLTWCFATSLAKVGEVEVEKKTTGQLRQDTFHSGLWTDEENTLRESTQRIRKIMDAIHKQQHPPRSTCKSRRLLIVQFSHTMEGIGSLLKHLTAGLAEAAHSNRTLIWGLDLPYSFGHTRRLWQSAAQHKPLSISGIDVFCDNGWLHQGGGPYSCFFQPLSTCSLEDADIEELVELGRRGFSDESRLKIMETRRGPACYHPPVNIPLFKNLGLFSECDSNGTINKRDGHDAMERHEWAAALAAYVFRLKRRLKKIFDNRRVSVWPIEAGGNVACQCGLNRTIAQSVTGNVSRKVWGFHIRHGDTKAMPKLYGNKRWYPFSEFLKAAREKAQVLAYGSCYQARQDGNEKDDGQCTVENYSLPSAIFVTSDNPEMPSEVQSACSTEELDEWPGGASFAPCIFFPEPSQRYRTAHGHVAAMEGACELGTCALYPDIAQYYRILNDQNPEVRAKRIFRTIVEGIEDLYALSYANVLAGTASSHFTVMGALLSWARYGVPPGAENVIYMDGELVESGVVQCGFLHTNFNKTSEIAFDKGHMRWTMHTRRFIEGLENEFAYKEDHDASQKELMLNLRMEQNLPKLPESIFRTEVKRWTGKQSLLWPGECPLPGNYSNDSDQMIIYATNLTNWGGAHFFLHTEQAMKCWLVAQPMLEELLKVEKAETKRNEILTLLDVLHGNLNAAQKQFSPYYLGEEGIKYLLVTRVAGPAESTMSKKFFTLGGELKGAKTDSKFIE